MGAHFAPSYANLAMGLWEHLSIWNDNPFSRYIVFIGRYIDYIIVIWDRTRPPVEQFVSHFNYNDLGLSFTFICSPESLAFLDLELCHTNSAIYAKNYIKPIVGNSYLHYQSC